ncbi:alginate export family protein [Pseudomonas indica]|uniref:Alginate production protein n=1 Tax=Pseudomonas indica TaxID=137658 RepID=A0A1G9CRX3_9PSED|nr:alginate export family protein [Pseudomonas indica]SDK54420.1 alginate production protein [Pseudomonas indica]
MKKNQKKNPWIGAGLGLSVTLISSAPAWAATYDAEKNFGLDVKVTGQSEDDRDLGTRDGGDVNGFALDLRPWLYGQSGNWSAYVMAQAVASTDIVETDPISENTEEDTTSTSNRREPDKNYLALREFWVDYAGLTAYPGEHLRFGRQRVRSDEGTWWDTNIEALNWTFDTTLLRANLGVAERFSDYRTDLDDLAPEDEDRQHLFGSISTQLAPGHWVGLKAHHSRDDGDLPDVGEEVDELTKTYKGDLTWLGINADGEFFNPRSTMPLNYWAQLTWLTGQRDSITEGAVNGQRVVTGEQDADVSAWAIDLGLRWTIDQNWKIGGAYARGSGGGDDGSDQFVQTGMESNRSNFTGTQSRLHRFGEAFRGELSNLQSVTAFTSWTLREDYDASLVYHRFWRVDSDQSIGQAGVNAALVEDDKDIGQEVDLVVTRYFRQGLLPASMSQSIDERSALVRFRGGLFFPGDAYGSQADSVMHRAFVDFIWRF